MTKIEAIAILEVSRHMATSGRMYNQAIDMAIEALSADAESDDLIIKGAKGIQDGLYNIKDGKLFKYKGKGGTVRTYPIVPSADAPKGDLISRQWLLEVYGDYIGDNGESKYHVPLEVVRQNIKDAPPADAEPKWNCTANFVAEQLDRLRKMTDEERWEFFKRFFEMKGGDE